MGRRTIFGILLLALFHLISGLDWQHPLVSNSEAGNDEPPHPKIAIIGAGISGVLAAFYLQEQFYNHEAGPLVTIFEASNRIGGRIKSVRVPALRSDESNTEDIGSKWISKDDHCVLESLEHAGLKHALRVELGDPSIRTGVWDGEDLQLAPVCMENRPSRDFCWLSCLLEGLRWSPRVFLDRVSVNIDNVVARIRWRTTDAFSARSFYEAAQTGLDNWKRFGASYTFTNLAAELKRCKLDNAISGPASSYFKLLNLSSDYISSTINPCSRAFFAQEVQDIRGLHAVVGSSQWHGSYFIHGGMKRLLERAVQISGAQVQLNSTVMSIKPGPKRRYILSISEGNTGPSKESEFDYVVIAAPFKNEDEYVGVHTTVFSTDSTMAPSYFGSQLNPNRIPDRIFTNVSAITKPGLLSIWTRRFHYRSDACAEDEDCDVFEDKHVYHILSRKVIDDEEIMAMLGRELEKGRRLEAYGVDWVHRQHWPQGFQRVEHHADIPEEIELAPGLLHISSGAEILDTMEMGCRMGRNAARLVFDNRARFSSRIPRFVDIDPRKRWSDWTMTTNDSFS